MIEYEGIVYNLEVFETSGVVWGQTQVNGGGIGFHINQDSNMIIYLTTYTEPEIEETTNIQRFIYECNTIECGMLALKEKDLGLIKILDSKYTINATQPISN